VAGSSYFMDFGFDSIEQVVDLIAELSEKIDALSTGGVPSSGQNSVPQGMLDELQQLRTTVEELKAQVSATGQSTPDENDRSSVLLFALLGGGVILILGTGGLLAALIRRGTR
ncbi:MAG: hypothetical protein O6920_01045, partial [Chloroflexi bacterium]|nr:hypothetical protein [Chloroflexota bacterium]